MSRAAQYVLLAIVPLGSLTPPAYAQNAGAPGDTCAGGDITAGMQQANNNAIYLCTTTGATRKWYAEPLYLGASSATCDASYEGLHRYNTTTHHTELCNGSAWTQVYEVQSTPAITAPSGSGYFVLTHTTYNGNLGDLTGADTKCLTEVGTTNTAWRGYSTANGNGQITSQKVKAFICNSTTCNNLMPLTTYAVAYANSGTPGGATFTTDSSGNGPSDSNAWSAANYFSGTFTWWSGRAAGSSTLWPSTSVGSNAVCNNGAGDWGASSGFTGSFGNTSTTDGGRWNASTSACNSTRRLICFVNP